MSDYDLNIRLVFILGIFLTSALFFILLYFSFQRRSSLLWLALYCISHPIKSLFKPWQSFISTDFLVQFQTHAVSQFIVLFGGFCLVGFILWELDIFRKKRLIIGYGIFCLLSFFILSDRQYSDSLSLVTIGLAVYGLYMKKAGSWILLSGMIGYTAILYLGHAEILGLGYFTAIVFFIGCMLVLIQQKVSQEIRLRQASSLRAASLENKLLKRAIQPHFIFNSLAALQELIEQNPAKASDFVEKLSGEFRLINQLSPQKLIPITDEINLCKMHLGIMEYRRDAKFSFKVIGISGNELVPPGIFHTLIENGLTHGYANKKNGHFELHKASTKNYIEYVLFNDSDVNTTLKPSVGTGLRYVKAQLETQYQNRWSLESKSVEQGWKVTIRIRN